MEAQLTISVSTTTDIDLLLALVVVVIVVAAAAVIVFVHFCAVSIILVRVVPILECANEQSLIKTQNNNPLLCVCCVCKIMGMICFRAKRGTVLAFQCLLLGDCFRACLRSGYSYCLFECLLSRIVCRVTAVT